MKTEAAIIFVIEIAGFVFFFGLVPLVAVVAGLPRVWRQDRGAGLLLLGVLINTALLFAALFAAFAGLLYSGG